MHRGDQIFWSLLFFSHSVFFEVLMRQERVKELLEYREGDLFWRVKRPRRRAGDRAGSVSPLGYRQVTLDGRTHPIHRVVWVYHRGPIPEGMTVDHINKNKSDNRIENLRLLSFGDNVRAATATPRSDNTTGFPGVVKCGAKYRARIRHEGVTHHLGYFGTAEEAHKALVEARATLKVPYNRIKGGPHAHTDD